MQCLHTKRITGVQRKKIICFSCKRVSKKRRKPERETRGEPNLQINNQNSPKRRREEPREEQNRVNEEKESNTQRPEIQEVTWKEKVGEGIIRKVRTQGKE